MRYFQTYKFNSDAKEICRSHKAELLSLSYEQDIDAFPAPPTTAAVTYFVGLEYSDTRTWFWSSGEPLTYPTANEPNGGQYLPGSCGGLTMNKGADKRRFVVRIQRDLCTSRIILPFICQRFGRYSTFM